MNRSSDIHLESSREEEEPVTVAEAARRAGVHPNTVRRLIHRGSLGALMIKGRHGDTWIVDAVELRRLVSGTLPGGASPAGASPSGTPKGVPAAAAAPTAATMDDAPARWDGGALPATVDLSLERAQALERYTHGLLAPLVELLRERETALERREEIVRRQAERIGRLEREVELLRAQLSRAAPAGTTASSTPAPLESTESEGVHAEGNYESIQVEGVHDEAVALASQVARLRGDLRSLAVHLEERTSFAPSRDLAPPAPLDRMADPAPAGSERAERADEAAPAVAPAPPPSDSPAPWEAPLPSAPLAPSGPPAPSDSPAPSESPPPAGPDPFAEAAAAIRQLQVALQGQSPAPRRAVQAAQAVQDVPDVQDAPAESAPAEAVAPQTPPPLAAAPVRRPWWRFWR